MKGVSDYREIIPKKKWFKTQVTRAFFFFLGMGMQTAYRIDPDVKKEVDSWPETYSFRIAAVGGPGLLMLKKAGSFQYLGEKETFYCDLELWYKNIDYAYLSMTGLISLPNTVYHNRQFVRGNLYYMMSMIRVINTVETLLLPNFIARFYMKDVPRLTFKKIINRVITYINIGYGAIK